jgi:hypothetical protein
MKGQKRFLKEAQWINNRLLIYFLALLPQSKTHTKLAQLMWLMFVKFRA